MPKSDVFRTPAGKLVVQEAYDKLLDQTLSGIERSTIHTKLGSTFVLSAGPVTAPPVVLLHGSGSTASSWALELNQLAAKYRLHAIDVVGEPGRSTAVRPSLTSDAYASWLSEVTAALHASPAVVVGVSLGGWLGLDYAIRKPSRVSALVLISPSGIGRRAVAPLLVAGVLSALGDRGRRAALSHLLGLPPRLSVEFLNSPVGQLTLLTLKHYRPRIDPIPTFTDEQLTGLTIPVTIVYGKRDRMLDAVGSAGRARRLLGDSAVDLVSDAGHFLPDQTVRISHALDAFRSRPPERLTSRYNPGTVR